MHDKINVCLLNDSFPPVIDGVANAVVNYGEIISTKNLGKATVVTPDYPDAVDDYPFDVVRYPSLSTEQLVGYRAGVPFDAKIFGQLERAGFNIIHTHCPVVSTLMARTLREKLDIPVVFTYHTKFDVNICDMVRSKLIQDAALHNLCANIQSCDEVWVVSRGAGENLRGIGYEGDYIVMENGVDFPKGRVTPDEAMEVRREYGIGPDERVFMYVGRMMWYKGIRITLDGLKKAKEEGFAFKMIFVGDGADRPEMEKYAKELGLEKECIFPGAIRDRELLRRYFCAADMFLFPSTFDTNGIVVREAAACGLPSV
ncbi:MAG: glycosyltransferase, partial [Clostridiales bacterium]|nr:glycosyltransferase [Clostridiales bacterium]